MNIKNTDSILVIGVGISLNAACTQPSTRTRLVAEKCVELYKLDPENTFLFFTSHGFGKEKVQHGESHHMWAIAKYEGVPEAYLDLEIASKSTPGNAEQTLLGLNTGLWKRNCWRKVILVGDATHIGRISWTFPLIWKAMGIRWKDIHHLLGQCNQSVEVTTTFPERAEGLPFVSDDAKWFLRYKWTWLLWSNLAGGGGALLYYLRTKMKYRHAHLHF